MPTTPSTSSLKIGLVLDTSLDPPDGVQQYVIAIGEWLRAQGHDVHYLVGETTARQLPNIHSLTRNISVSFNGNRTTIPLFLSRAKARACLEAERFDILHVQTPHHPFMSQKLVLAAPKSTAVLATFHILPYSYAARLATKLLGLLLRPSLGHIDTMLAVSSSAAQFEEKVFGLPAVVLPNVIDYTLFRTAEPLPDQKDVLTILFLGRLVERKGCQVLLEAVSFLQKSPVASTLPKFRVVVCGKGHLRPQLEKYVADEGLGGIVTFEGFVSEADKPRYYASADISVFPSSGGESFGIVLLEAMASGKSAVLAGDNEGYRSVLTNTPDLLFSPKDSRLLADKIRDLLQHPKKRHAIAEEGSQYAATFDVNLIGQKLVKEYNQALHSRRNLQ